MHYLVGMSRNPTTERAAREEAMNHARVEFAKYPGVEVTDLNEISHHFYGKSSGILDPEIALKTQSIQKAEAIVRRTRAKEWYFEKLVKRCRGTDLHTAYQYWVLAEVPLEEYDRIQTWKKNRFAKKEAAADARLAKREAEKTAQTEREKQEADRQLKQASEAHQQTFSALKGLLKKADFVAALALLQADSSRISHSSKQLQTSGSPVSFALTALNAM